MTLVRLAGLLKLALCPLFALDRGCNEDEGEHGRSLQAHPSFSAAG